MARLHIALQEGFAGDTVSVRVNGSEVARRSNVATRNQIGFAEAIELDVNEGEIQLELRVESRSLEQRMPMRVVGTTYLGVSIEREGKLRSEVSQQPFRYL
jgi:hypothetical protein